MIINEPENIGFRLKKALHLLDAKTIAKRFDLSEQYVLDMMEANEINNTIAKIANYYHINLNWLVFNNGSICNDSNVGEDIQSGNFIQNSEYYIRKLMIYYEVVTVNELAEKIDTPAGTISKWKQRNSINVIKKKCRELGIYEDIFDDIETIDNGENINKKVLDIVEVAQAVYSKDANKEEYFIGCIKEWVRENI